MQKKKFRGRGYVHVELAIEFKQIIIVYLIDILNDLLVCI